MLTEEEEEELETAPFLRARGKLGGILNVGCVNLRNKKQRPIGHKIINNAIPHHKVIKSKLQSPMIFK